MSRRILLELHQARLGFDHRQDLRKSKALQAVRIAPEFRAQHVCGRLKAAVIFEKYPGGFPGVGKLRDRIGYDPEGPDLRMELPAGTEIVEGDIFVPCAPFDCDLDGRNAEKMFKLPGNPLLQPDLARPSAIEEYLSALRPQRMQRLGHLVGPH